jgi:hypothetical protein
VSEPTFTSGQTLAKVPNFSGLSKEREREREREVKDVEKKSY